MIITIIFIYLGVVLFIGTLSHRLFRGTGEDYFIASRTIGPFILLMSLFGTHMTAFALLGSSGEAYHAGIGIFGLMASAAAIVVPTVFFFIGTRLWVIGKRHGYLTQVQFFRARWGSDRLGLLLFVVLVGFMIPYILIGVMGGGITMHNITGGQIPQWAGGLLVCAVIFGYVSYGGLRGTSWVNTFQTLVFMILGAITYFIVINKLGGLSAAMRSITDIDPGLLIRGDRISPLKFFSYIFIPLSVGMFPHMFMHWLSAKSSASFRIPIIYYPVCLAIVWIPSVLLGVLGNIDFRGLEGPESNSVLILMVAEYAPGILGGLLAAGVFAAIMSSLDSQTLSMGTMFTQDIVRHYGYQDKLSEKQQVLFGRLFVLGILLVAYVLSLVSERSIFKLAIWSFSGFAALFPLVIAAIFWRRSTSYGAFASILCVAVLWIYFFIRGWETSGYSVGNTGLMPVAVLLGASSAVLVIVSLLTRPPEPAIIDKFFRSPGARE